MFVTNIPTIVNLVNSVLEEGEKGREEKNGEYKLNVK